MKYNGRKYSVSTLKTSASCLFSLTLLILSSFSSINNNNKQSGKGGYPLLHDQIHRMEGLRLEPLLKHQNRQRLFQAAVALVTSQPEHTIMITVQSPRDLIAYPEQLLNWLSSTFENVVVHLEEPLREADILPLEQILKSLPNFVPVEAPMSQDAAAQLCNAGLCLEVLTGPEKVTLSLPAAVARRETTGIETIFYVPPLPEQYEGYFNGVDGRLQEIPRPEPISGITEDESAAVVVPGSFDPVTVGHLEAIMRAAKIFSRVHVVVANDPRKTYLFPIDERTRMLEEAIQDAGLDNVVVKSTSGIVPAYMVQHGIATVLRGIRGAKDWATEHRVSSGYHRMADTWRTQLSYILLPSSREQSTISATAGRKLISTLGIAEELTAHLPAPVVHYLQKQGRIISREKLPAMIARFFPSAGNITIEAIQPETEGPRVDFVVQSEKGPVHGRLEIFFETGVCICYETTGPAGEGQECRGISLLADDASPEVCTRVAQKILDYLDTVPAETVRTELVEAAVFCALGAMEREILRYQPSLGEVERDAPLASTTAGRLIQRMLEFSYLIPEQGDVSPSLIQMAGALLMTSTDWPGSDYEDLFIPSRLRPEARDDSAYRLRALSILAQHPELISFSQSERGMGTYASRTRRSGGLQETGSTSAVKRVFDAWRMGIRELGIVDRYSLEGAHEAVRAARILNGAVEIVPGLELDCIEQGLQGPGMRVIAYLPVAPRSVCEPTESIHQRLEDWLAWYEGGIGTETGRDFGFYYQASVERGRLMMERHNVRYGDVIPISGEMLDNIQPVEISRDVTALLYDQWDLSTLLWKTYGAEVLSRIAGCPISGVPDVEQAFFSRYGDRETSGYVSIQEQLQRAQLLELFVLWLNQRLAASDSEMSLDAEDIIRMDTGALPSLDAKTAARLAVDYAVNRFSSFLPTDAEQLVSELTTVTVPVSGAIPELSTQGLSLKRALQSIRDMGGTASLCLGENGVWTRAELEDLEQVLRGLFTAEDMKEYSDLVRIIRIPSVPSIDGLPAQEAYSRIQDLAAAYSEKPLLVLTEGNTRSNSLEEVSYVPCRQLARFTRGGVAEERERPLVVGLVGIAGAGKSTLLSALWDSGLETVRLDDLAREARADPDVQARIIEAFGPEVTTPDETLDTDMLRELITADEKKRRRLRNIVFPEILRRLERRIQDAEERDVPVVAVEAANLFTSGLGFDMDYVLCIDAPPEIAAERLEEKRGYSPEHAMQMVSLQDRYLLRTLSDTVVINDGAADAFIDEGMQKIDAFVHEVTESRYAFLREKQLGQMNTALRTYREIKLQTNLESAL